MSRESLILLIGVIVFLTPLLSVPEDWKRYVIAVCGAVLVVLGYFLRRAAYLRQISMGNGERGTDSFVESHVSIDDVSSMESLSGEGELERV